TEKEIERYYDVVWKAQNTQDMVMIKTLLYTGVRVSELVHIKRADVDFTRFQIRINQGKGGKDRLVPFPASFKETLALHAANGKQKGAAYWFESSWKKKYTDGGVRKILKKYSDLAHMEQAISRHKLGHGVCTCLKINGTHDAEIQPT